MNKVALAVVFGFVTAGAWAIGVPLQTHEGFLTANYQTVFTNLTLDAIQNIGATMMGGNINSGSAHGLVTVGNLYTRVSADELTVLFSVNNKNILRGAQVSFHQNGNDIEAKLIKTCHNNGSTTYETTEHTGLAITANAGTWYATSLKEAGHGIGRLTAYGAGEGRVIFPGYATKTAQTFSSDVSRAALTDFYGFMVGASLIEGCGMGHLYAGTDTTANLQFIGKDGTNLKAVRVKLTDATPGFSILGLGNNYDAYTADSYGKYVAGNANTTVAETETGVGYGVRGISAHVSPLAYTAFDAGSLTGESRLVWSGVSLSDILTFEAVSKGEWIKQNNTMQACHVTNDGTTATVQFQFLDGSSVKCFKVEFTQNGADVWGRGLYMDYAATSVGFDFDAKSPHFQTTSPFNGYNVTALRAVLKPTGWKAWTGKGGDRKFSTAANWDGNVAPAAGDKVLLTGMDASAAIENDLPTGTALAALAYAGSGNLTLTGNGLVPSKVANYSTYGKFVIEAPVAVQNLSPFAGSGLSFKTLSVPGVLAPQGRRPVEIAESATIGKLFLGDSHVDVNLTPYSGLAMATLHALTGAGTKTVGAVDTATWTHSGFRFEGTNVFAHTVRPSQSTILSIGKGVTSIPELGAWDSNCQVAIEPEGELRIGTIDKDDEPAKFTVRVCGKAGAPGRFAIANETLALGTWFKGVGTRLATAGYDLSLTGSVKVEADLVGNDTLWLDATDADGTARTIALGATLSGTGKLGVCGGTVSVAAAVGVPVTVAAGGTLAAVGTVDVSNVELNGGALACSPNGLLDFGAAFDASNLVVRRTSEMGAVALLVADVISNAPARVADVNGKRWRCSVVNEGGRQKLMVYGKQGTIVRVR